MYIKVNLKSKDPNCFLSIHSRLHCAHLICGHYSNYSN